MSSKLEREMDSVKKAEAELRERKKKLDRLRQEEDEKSLVKLVKKAGMANALLILESALAHSPEHAISLLQNNSHRSDPIGASE